MVLRIALFEPEIPANAGNIARLCAATGVPLHLVGRLGFSFRHPAAKRAGMDYWEQVEVQRHVTYADFRDAVRGRRVWKLSTRGKTSLWEARFAEGDVLLFGPESRGLPVAILEEEPERVLRIPILPTTRSLNLANAVAVSLFEGLRQLGWSPAWPPETGGEGRGESGFPAS